jgi:hypothetical protein
MHKVSVITPSLNRPKLLSGLADNLLRNAPSFHHAVRYENQPQALPWLLNSMLRDAFNQRESDIVCFLADHCRVMPGFDKALRAIFEDGGLGNFVGFNVMNLDPKPGVLEYCFVAMGRDYWLRFIDGEVFCPDYYHFFADTEAGECAKKQGRFVMAQECRIMVIHPNAQNAASDDTHKASRRYIQQDREIRAQRQERGLTWGLQWDRVNPNPRWKLPDSPGKASGLAAQGK